MFRQIYLSSRLEKYRQQALFILYKRSTRYVNGQSNCVFFNAIFFFRTLSTKTSQNKHKINTKFSNSIPSSFQQQGFPFAIASHQAWLPVKHGSRTSDFAAEEAAAAATSKKP
jgi:hypothetical protein